MDLVLLKNSNLKRAQFEQLSDVRIVERFFWRRRSISTRAPSKIDRDCLFFCPDFSGDELQRDEDQAASSSGRANHYAVVPVPGVNPCLCLLHSSSGISTTDDFGFHFWNSATIFRAKLLTDGCIEPRLYERTGLNKGNQSSA